MTQSYVGLGALVSIMALAACGGEPANKPPSGGDVAAVAGSAQRVRACELLDIEAATRVIGSGTEHPGGDAEEQTCIYSNPGVATLTLQLGTAELYDQVTIMQPHTAVQIGSAGRYNVEATGVAAVQFVKGAYSVTLSARPLGTNDTQYLEPLISVARETADRLP